MAAEHPALDCDVVMKGGITSGVVYPDAVCRLAERYRFRAVGGTSAGAIAAATTAAAELERQLARSDGAATDPAAADDRGFARLATLGRFLATASHLRDLFQPDAGTRPYLRLLATVRGGRLRTAAALVAAAVGIRGARRWLAAGLLPGLVVTAACGLALAGAAGGWRVLAAAGVVVALGVLVVGAVLGGAVGVGRRVGPDLSRNRFGLCSGGPPRAGGSDDAGGRRLTPGPDAPLTVWLASELDGLADVAGRRRLVTRRDLEELGAVPADDRPDGVVTLGGLRSAGLEVVGADDRPARLVDLERAGLDVADLPAKPLTFGDLAVGGVTLRMLTTDLTHGRPYRLPLDPAGSVGDSGYFFHPDDVRELFPQHVAEWMEARPPRRPAAATDAEWREWQLLCALLEPLLPLPDPDDLPVVVAARLSLSFPVLLSAVPLHAVDWSLAANRAARTAWQGWLAEVGDDWRDELAHARGTEAVDDGAADRRRGPRATVCWLSDGGIASNFPIHFFDRPLPRWPTFGFNLREPHPDHPLDAEDPASGVWLPETAVAGHHLQWRTIDGLGRFLRLIADTMQNWGDRTQMRVHGYWDRVAHISLGPDEGGLNLDMDGALIEALGQRGAAAASALAERFAGDGPGGAPGWDEHRWLRYRSSMALIEGFLGRVAGGYRAEAQPGSRTYEALASRPEGEPPDTYLWDDRQRAATPDATGSLLDLVDAWEELGGGGPLFGPGAPSPSPELRIAPPL